MQTGYKYLLIIVLAAGSAVAVFKASTPKISAQPVVHNEATSVTPPSHVAGASTVASLEPAPALLMPISNGLTRITKKPFGLYVTPETSPVSEDIFTGYHTGIDFETLSNEQNTDVTITAACDGAVLVKEWAKGYGGVLVQACKLDGEEVSVIYGHLKLQSIMVNLGQTLLAGDQIGYLGQAFSHETDGRRKHLHFDIHKGTDINILGYVPKQDDLAKWIDPIKYLE